MKRTLPLFGLLGLAAALVPVLTVFAAGPSSPKRPKPPPVSIPGCGSKCGVTPFASTLVPPALAPGGDPVVQDLMAILNETSSPDTFMVTTMVLGKMGFAARPALPAIVRNGERLGLFRGLADPNKANGMEVAEAVMESIDLILAVYGAATAPVKPTCYGYATTPLGGTPPCIVAPQPAAVGTSVGVGAAPPASSWAQQPAAVGTPVLVSPAAPPPSVVAPPQPAPRAVKQRPKPPAPPKPRDFPEKPAS
jgi:hypothetical protein